MSVRHQRKKQPELVRQQLLEVAARLTKEQGLPSVTLDAVSRAAGVSKGGLLHHFPSKMALLEGLFDDLIGHFDAAIDEELRQDAEPHGRFSRAYLKAVTNLKYNPREQGEWAGVALALLTEPQLRVRYRDWLDRRCEEYVGTDSSVEALAVRLAADGLWFAELIDSQEMDDDTRQRLVLRLGELTRGR
ncbi:TetR/AcrR family transcriptional regulator [Rhizobiaceae bacterium n13]|uniref:TetR/AcrR family transcriptional regulator n=1 Tax=Ferirhizobium litorale TaxID=2927786 RepID=A0AAE3U0S0_9HYPH|nr:TetR/AcrR family transcriptional regulator [Fererhizobium litorale]MDI7860714.1 TetR/AcrR family transcriptional regulator [Fererhizobium litorale]MDI7920862.1 TetR/AcrR family transcriptional regulator [Fererhizobium litorale]